MDYAYFAPPVQPYPFFSLPGKPEQPYTPQEEPLSDPLVSTNTHFSSSTRWIYHNAYVLQDAFNEPNAFQYYDPTAFNANPIIPSSQSPPHSLHRPSISHALPYDSSGSISQEVIGDAEYDQNPGRGGSSDDDKDNLTPAQSRRKAQNRAAYIIP